MEGFITISGPLARDLILRNAEEFYNQCHSPSTGRFCGDEGGDYSPGVKKYLKDQYQMDPEKASELGLSHDGSKLLIPFKDEKGKTSSVKWRDTAVLEGDDRWGGKPPDNKAYHGLSVYENKGKTGPLFVVESPSEGLILAARNQRVVFFDGADSLVSRAGKVDKTLQTRLMKIVKGNDSILIPDNDVRGEAFAEIVEPLVSRRINPPPGYKDLRQFLVSGNGNLDRLIKKR